jgi:phosphopantothenoylcysteine decarboxylase/phosphopantothenate--cysteine ligase
MVVGIADNMLIATYLSAKCPVFFAPAMDLDMWKHPSTISNITSLITYGNQLIPVAHGELASGLVGNGRMAEPIDIVRQLNAYFGSKDDLLNKKVLITAGPTYEAIDPVRFIGNHSSGKMGVSLAEECANRGAIVTLILGPSKIFPLHHNIKIVNVVSAQEMYEAAHSIYPDQDAAIFTAAVADYTPAFPADQKIKKNDQVDGLELQLIRTKDIAYELGKIKTENQINIGFALETSDEEINAKRKLIKKNFDFIVLNSLADKGAGFQHKTNKITIYQQNGDKTAFSLKDKNEVAKDIVNVMVQMYTQI